MIVDFAENETAVLEAWDEIASRVPRAALTQEVELSVATARALASGQPLTEHQLSAVWGVPLEQTQQILEAAKGRSIEVDGEGRLVGAAGLSLNETAHELWVEGRNLFAWCAWDALFLPAYLDTRATVRSADPVTGEPITVEVAPTSIVDSEPDSAVLTVLVPDLDSDMGLTGPGTERCSTMQFFADQGTAQNWIGGQTRIVTLTTTQALDIAHRTWLSLLQDHT